MVKSDMAESAIAIVGIGLAVTTTYGCKPAVAGLRCGRGANTDGGFAGSIVTEVADVARAALKSV